MYLFMADNVSAIKLYDKATIKCDVILQCITVILVTYTKIKINIHVKPCLIMYFKNKPDQYCTVKETL